MADDLLILCSNGLSDCLSADASEIAGLCKAGAPAALHTRLVEFALSRKSDDNITAVVAQITAGSGSGFRAHSDRTRSAQTAGGASRAQDLSRDPRRRARLAQDARAIDVQARQAWGHHRPARQPQRRAVRAHRGPKRGPRRRQGHRAPGPRRRHRRDGVFRWPLAFSDDRRDPAHGAHVHSALGVRRAGRAGLAALGYRILQAVVVAMAGKLEEKLTEPRA